MTSAVSLVCERVPHSSIQIYIYIFYIVTGLGQMPAGGRGPALPRPALVPSERAKKYAMAFCYFATPNTAHKCKRAREPTLPTPHSPIMQSSVCTSVCVFLAELMSHQEPCPGTSWRVFYTDFYRGRQ